MSGVIKSAAFGIPLPICSCGIVPISIELHRKGASRPSIMSFLITTPESGSDSILITWGLLGPFMAIARPIASFLSALLAGAFAIGLLKDSNESDTGINFDTGCRDNCQDDPERDKSDYEEEYVGLKGFWTAIQLFIRRLSGTKESSVQGYIQLSEIFKRIWNYAFKKMADEIVFSLLVGLILAGFIIIVLPDNLAMYGLERGILPMLIMLAASVPIYMCASASTPIAAALIVKGISPGAAMVFLLAGPATNITTLVMLTKQFGGGFVRVYLACIIAGALISGLLFDYLLVVSGTDIVPTLSMENHSIIGAFQWISALLLIALMVWRFWNGAVRTGLRDLSGNALVLFSKNRDSRS